MKQTLPHVLESKLSTRTEPAGAVLGEPQRVHGSRGKGKRAAKTPKPIHLAKVTDTFDFVRTLPTLSWFDIESQDALSTMLLPAKAGERVVI